MNLQEQVVSKEREDKDKDRAEVEGETFGQWEKRRIMRGTSG